MLYQEIKDKVNKSYQCKLFKCKELYWSIMKDESISFEDKKYFNSMLVKETKEYFINKSLLDDTLKDLEIRKKREIKSKRAGAFDRRNIYEFYINTYIIANFTESLAIFYFNKQGDALFNNYAATHNLEKNQKINSNFDFIYLGKNKKIWIEQQTYFDKKEYIEIKQTKMDSAKELNKENKPAYFINMYIPDTNNFQDIEFSFMNMNKIIKEKKTEEHLTNEYSFGGKEYVKIKEKLEWKKNPKSLKVELK